MQSGPTILRRPAVPAPALLTVIVSLLAVLAGLASASSARAAGWRSLPTPVPGAYNGALQAVSCVTSTTCIAVGDYDGAGREQLALSERLSEGAWAPLATAPLPGDDDGAQLRAIGCVTATDCVAVGSVYDGAGLRQPLAETYNGAGWVLTPVALPAADRWGVLRGVSCPTAGDCVAVGYAYTAATDSEVELAYRFDGIAWTAQATPATVGDQLDSVSCVSTTLCWAVGATADSTLAQRFNGSSWTVAATPDSPDGELESVSCPTDAFCMAVGVLDRDAGLDGLPISDDIAAGAWSAVPVTLSGAGEPDLGSVSCTSASACTAMGPGEVDFSQIGVTRFNGVAWAQQTFSVPGDPLLQSGGGVACPSARTCVAVAATAVSLAGDDLPLAESWNSSAWSAMSLKAPEGTDVSQMLGDSCATGPFCAGVGDYIDSAGITLALADTWSSTGWVTGHAAQVPGALSSILDGVSCPAAGACTAVGETYDSDSGIWKALAERLSGGGWTLQSAAQPAAGFQNASLESVSCATVSDCVAVGSWIDSAGDLLPLTEHFNGSAWTVVRAVVPAGSGGAAFDGVSCTATTACTAVGFSGEDALVGAPLAERWNGSGWAVQPTPAPPSDGALNGVSCVTATSCTAIGTQIRLTYAEAWNGSAWSLQTTAVEPDAQNNYATAIGCLSATSCVSVGWATSPSISTEPAGEVLSGMTWTEDDPPSSTLTSSPQTRPQGVSCASGVCLEVGQDFAVQESTSALYTPPGS